MRLLSAASVCLVIAIATGCITANETPGGVDVEITDNVREKYCGRRMVQALRTFCRSEVRAAIQALKVDKSGELE